MYRYRRKLYDEMMKRTLLTTTLNLGVKNFLCFQFPSLLRKPPLNLYWTLKNIAAVFCLLSEFYRIKTVSI